MINLRHTAHKNNSETHDENSGEDLSADIDGDKRPVGEENDIQAQVCNEVDLGGHVQDYSLDLKQTRLHDRDVDLAIDLVGTSDGVVCNMTWMVSTRAVIHRIQVRTQFTPDVLDPVMGAGDDSREGVGCTLHKSIISSRCGGGKASESSSEGEGSHRRMCVFRRGGYQERGIKPKELL